MMHRSDIPTSQAKYLRQIRSMKGFHQPACAFVARTEIEGWVTGQEVLGRHLFGFPKPGVFGARR
jgi:hypothetical protein